MASKQSKFKRSFPFLLALVVLISCLPVVPVSAANSMTLEGVWQIGEGWEADVSHGDIRDFSISVDAYVYGNGSMRSITGIFLDSQEPESLGIYYKAGGVDRMWESSGDHYSDDGRIYFNVPVTITDSQAIAFFSTYASPVDPSILSIDGHEVHRHYDVWCSQSIVESSGTTFECDLCDWEYIWTPSGAGSFLGFEDLDSGHLYFGQVIFDIDGHILLISKYSTPVVPDPEPDPDPGATTYTSTITIDGQKFIFTSTTEQPKISLQVISTGVLLTFDGSTRVYSFSGVGIFQGLSFSASGAASFVPGETYELAAGDHVLYSVSGHVIDPDQPPSADLFTAIIVIDGRSFEFSGGDSYPVVRLGVGSSKVVFGLGDTVVNYWYPTPLGGQSFLGFSTSSDCTVVDYPVNEVNSPALSDPVIQFCDISFSQSNSVLTLYPVYSYSSSGGSGGSGSGSVDDPAGVGTILSRFAQFLVSPLMVFFNAEFIPGFSFGKLALVAFCFGLVFWLLRVSS